MYIFTNPNDNRRNIDTTAVLGGKFVLDYSDTLSSLPAMAFFPNAPPVPMVDILNFNCITSTYEARDEKIISVLLYPNPFNNFIQVEYDLIQSSEVNLSIYDATGRIVRRLELGRQEIGKQIQNVEFNPPTGIYFVRLQTDYGFQTLKIIKH